LAPWTVGDLEHYLLTLSREMLPCQDWMQADLVQQLMKSIAQHESSRKKEHIHHGCPTIFSEMAGQYDFFPRETHERTMKNPETEKSSVPRPQITLTTRLDRVEIDGQGALHIIDYKTGTVPSFTAVQKGQAIQLPTQAWMIHQGACAVAMKSVLGDRRPVFQDMRLSWWNLSLTKGFSVRTYPYTMDILYEWYDHHIPQWLTTLARGDFFLQPPSPSSDL
jgi:hypothetical protein